MANDKVDKVIAPDGLEITVAHGDEGALLRLNGRLNIDSSPALRDRLLALLHSEPPEAVNVDLAEVPYIDCSGIATLIEALKIARNHQTTLHLQGLHNGLFHLLKITGVLSLFEGNGDARTPAVPKVS